MRNLGTSSLVVAAFVGPGTVLTCAAAGMEFSYSLGWVLVVATVATLVLQTFTAGCGILARKGMGEAIREITETRWYRIPLFVLVVVGLWLGVAAFETGNLVGASAGMTVLTGRTDLQPYWSVACAGVAAAILSGRLALIRRSMTVVVLLMTASFVTGSMLVRHDVSALFRGLFKPAFPDGSLLTALALVGTTVVTYNLFLHASVAKRHWEGTPREVGWRQERFGMLLFIPLGGLISLAILFTGASLSGMADPAGEIDAFAGLLDPVAGRGGLVLFGLGLFAAGITSAVTAPLAAAEGISELFGWMERERGLRYRLVWLSVLLCGLAFSLSGVSPIRLIVLAQAANGILLPLVAGIVVTVTVKQDQVSVSRGMLAAGVAVVLFCLLLGARTLTWVWSQVA